jgi:hypothetical protein
MENDMTTELDDFTLTALTPLDPVSQAATEIANHIQQTLHLPLEDFLTLHGLLQEKLKDYISH